MDHQGDFLFIHPKISAKKTFHRETVETWLIAALLVLLLLYVLRDFGGIAIGTAVVAAGIAFYLVTIGFKALVFFLALHQSLHNPSKCELVSMNESELPFYTVLIPAYKESGVIKTLIHSLNLLDYPRDKLDIKILLEADDLDTRSAVAECADVMGPEYSVLALPHSHPKTKPKSLNAGLLEARGEYLTIYDAEDIPDPDQLKKAVWIFDHSDPDLLAIQSKLYFYNPNENFLSRWFAAEYAVWFEYVLPGLHALQLPIPLGGTSNHFKTKALIDMGGWDPYNVTEDADLGMRISRIGGKIGIVESITWGQNCGKNMPPPKYGVGMLDSVTLEESNTLLSNWFNQRSRWMKGYMQTFIVHLRHPLQTWRDYSFGGLITFFFIILGTPITHMLNMFFWALTIIWLLWQPPAISAMFPEPLLTLGWFSFIFGNALFILMHVLAPLRKKQWKIALFALLMPIYWLLMAVATFKGLWQLFVKPHHWEKTKHGIAAKSRFGLFEEEKEEEHHDFSPAFGYVFRRQTQRKLPALQLASPEQPPGDSSN